jgi:hypothetical protein
MVQYVDKSFIVSLFGLVSMEVLKEIPGMMAGWVQLLIGILTVLYLIKKLRRK